MRRVLGSLAVLASLGLVVAGCRSGPRPLTYDEQANDRIVAEVGLEAARAELRAILLRAVHPPVREVSFDDDALLYQHGRGGRPRPERVPFDAIGHLKEKGDEEIHVLAVGGGVICKVELVNHADAIRFRDLLLSFRKAYLDSGPNGAWPRADPASPEHLEPAETRELLAEVIQRANRPEVLEATVKEDAYRYRYLRAFGRRDTRSVRFRRVDWIELKKGVRAYVHDLDGEVIDKLIFMSPRDAERFKELVEALAGGAPR